MTHALSWPFKQWRWVDGFLIPAFMMGLMFEPNLLHGWVDYLEAGQYLGPINRILHGGTPYVDGFTQHGPLSLYLPAALMVFFGKTIAVLRAYFHASNILGLLAAYGVGCLVCKNRFFRTLLALLLVVEAFHPFWSTRWGGLRVGISLLTLGGLIQYAKTGSRRTIGLAGFLTGLGLLYSTEVGIFSLMTAAALFFGMKRGRTGAPRGLLRDATTYLAGWGMAMLPMLVFLAAQGAWVAYIKTAWWILPTQSPAVWSQVENIPSLASAFRQAPNLLSVIASDTFKIYLPSLLYPVFGASLLTKLGRQRQVTSDDLVVGLLIFNGLLLYVASFRAILSTQFQMAALPPLIILSVLFLEKLYRRVRQSVVEWKETKRPPRLPALLAAGVLMLSTAYFVGSGKRYYGSLRGWFLYQRYKPNLIASYLAPRWPKPGSLAPLQCKRGGGIRVPAGQAEEIDGVTAFIKKHTAAGETVFAFPEHGIFNFLADRPGLSRFDIAGLAWTTPAWRTELLKELQTHPPRYAVVGRRLSNLALSIHRKEELLPEVRQYLVKHYRIVGTFPSVCILERIEPDGPSS